MSYARYSYADVYVFLSCYGTLDCCGCSLDGSASFQSTADMLAHLDRHRATGHDVPQETYDELLADAAENDKHMAEVAAGKCCGCDGSGECRDYLPHDPKEPVCVFCKGTKKCGQCGGLGGSKDWAASRVPGQGEPGGGT